MELHQSDIKQFSDCSLAYYFSKKGDVPRQQSCALTFGTIMHDVILFLETTQDLEAAIQRFMRFWAEPTLLEQEIRAEAARRGEGKVHVNPLTIDYFLPRRSWSKYRDQGVAILRNWWDIIQWERDIVLGRELYFRVPVGDHHLAGTIDKLVVRDHPKRGRMLLISDYKTGRSEPTYGYLAHDIQFTAYAFATTRPEFWVGVPNGDHLYRELSDVPRYGEWVQLGGGGMPKRKDAGIRNEVHYNRLTYAVQQIARAIEEDIYVPTIAGDSCGFCEFRKVCGLTPLEEEDNSFARKYGRAS